MRKTRSYLIGATLLAALVLPVSALAQSGAPAPARVRHFEGSVTVQRAQAGETSEALVNLPLEAGDRLWTASDGRAEIVLPDGSWLWLDAATTIDVTALDSDGGETILRLWSGSMILRREHTGDGVRLAPVRVDAPTGSVVIGDQGLYRIDLDDEQRFWLSVLQGRAELVAGGVSEPLASGQRSFAEPGTAPARAVDFNTAEQDSFDRWQEQRLADFAVRERHVAGRQYVPQTVVHHVVDLEPYGAWGYYDEIGAWGWRPQVSPGWAPYRHGRWVYTHHGWSWVSYSPWGWATSHYGRWHFAAGHGWLWFPGPVYSPAWVNWYVSPGYIGWVPINYWNRPVVSLNFFFGWGDRYDPYWGHRDRHDRWDRGGIAVAGRGYARGLDQAWTVVPADRFGARDVGRVAVERTAVPRQDSSIQVKGPLRPREPARALVPSSPARVAVSRGDGPSPRGRGAVPANPSVGTRPGSDARVMTPGGPSSGERVVRPSPGSGADERGRAAIPRRPQASGDDDHGTSRRIVVPDRPATGSGRAGDAGARTVVPRRPTLEVGRSPRPGDDQRGPTRGAIVRPTPGDDRGGSAVRRPTVRGDAEGRSIIRPSYREGDPGSRSVVQPPYSGSRSGSSGIIRRPTVRGDYGSRRMIPAPDPRGSTARSPVISRRSDSGRSLLQRIFSRSGGSSLGRPSASGSAPRIARPSAPAPRSSVRGRSSAPSRSAKPRKAKPKGSGNGS